ncbi:RNA polymerase sigma factor [candidate division KSB1 bacterium]
MKNEKLLIYRVRNGDRTAFREIVEHYKKSVYYYAVQFLHDHHDAEDVSQEVFLKMFRSLDKFREKSKISTWLYRITFNTCIDKKRCKKSNVLLFQENNEIDETMVKYSNDHINYNPEKFVEHNEMDMLIEKALEKITYKEKNIFILRFYSELSLRDIAEILNVSESTIKSLLYRAIRKLRKELLFYSKEIVVGKTK